jgi:hypothetical protein
MHHARAPKTHLRAFSPHHSIQLVVQDLSQPREKLPPRVPAKGLNVYPTAAQRALQEISGFHEDACPVAGGEYLAGQGYELGALGTLSSQEIEESVPRLGVPRFRLL